jgi:predicted phage tail protein
MKYSKGSLWDFEGSEKQMKAFKKQMRGSKTQMEALEKQMEALEKQMKAFKKKMKASKKQTEAFEKQRERQAQMPQPPQRATMAAPPSTDCSWQKPKPGWAPFGAAALHQAVHCSVPASTPARPVPPSPRQGISTS